MLSDLRFALRILRRSRGFASIAIATLGIGVGAATAIFSMVDAVVLRPLPYPDPARLVRLYETTRDDARESHSGPDFLDYRAQGRSVFSAIAAARQAALNMSGRGPAVQLSAMIVTPEFFDVFGVAPTRGRTFTDADRLAAARPIVLGYGAWQKHFGGRDEALGQVVRLARQPHQIVGVMPAGFPAETSPDLWMVSRKDVPETPFPDPRDLEHDRAVHYLSVVARLRPGVSVATADAAVQAIASGLAKQYPDTNGHRGARVVPLHDDLVGAARPAMLLLLGAVAVVLAVVAANIAGLLLARGAARHKEIAVRAALGASRTRLLRQALAESLVLGAVGAALGLLLASWTLDLFVALGPGDVPRLALARIDARVFLFCALLAGAVALAAGLIPALTTTTADLAAVIHRTIGGGRSRQRLRSILVASELMASAALLVLAALLGRSFANLQRVDVGFDAERVFTVGMPLPESEYREEHRQREFFRTLLPRVALLGGVRSAAAAFPRPWSGAQAGGSFEIEGRGDRTDGVRNQAGITWITPDYFRAMHIPLRRGRVFTERDTDRAPRVIVINERMAHRFWPRENAIGKRIRFDPDSKEPWFEVVGIVGDTRTHGVGEPAKPEFYVSHAQSAIPFMTLILRTSGDVSGLAAAIRTEVASLDPNLAVGNLTALTSARREQLAPSRFRTILLALFGSATLLLAALGVYGIVSFSVAQRTAEIGIRVALGASRRHVRSLVMRQGLVLAAAGIAAGLAAALLATAWLGALLFQVTPVDPTSMSAVALVLLGVALGAAYLPARRALRIDPAYALRSE